jgi:hypothetical protein
MRIESSSIQLSGLSTSVEKQTKDESLKTWVGDTRSISSGENSTGLSTIADAEASDILQLSDEGKAALAKQMAASNTDTVTDEDDPSDWLIDKDKQKILMLQKMLEALTGKKIRFIFPGEITLSKSKIDKLNEEMQSVKTGHQAVQIQQRQGWGLEYDLHETHYEKQTLSFSAEGTVKTADGKEIKLDLDLNMSREFASSLDVSLRAGDALKVDPLVINFDSPAAKLTNNKFSFDIDNDGDNDQISFATGGSGFLALDANNDGTVNNGSELFGPQSGNGFTDLAKYDGDNNGWIDENDDIYNKLRIWTKDENGNDQLFALGEKGVGAIYLGNAATAFDMKNNSNQTLGSIASTGIYLSESGLAGTMQHVDLTI